MLSDFVRRAVRSWLVTDSVERELFYILVLVRWLLIMMVVMFGVWSAVFVVQDAWWLWRAFNDDEMALAAPRSGGGWPGGDFNAATVVKTIILGTLAFVVPRLLWAWWTVGLPWQRRLEEERQQVFTSDDGKQRSSPPPPSSSFMPKPEILLPTNSPSLKNTCEKYRRVLSELQRHTVEQFRFRSHYWAKLADPALLKVQRLERTVAALNEHQKKSKNYGVKRVFVLGRKGAGKTELLNALLDCPHVAQEVVHAGPRNLNITMTRATLSDQLVEFYELPALNEHDHRRQRSKPTLQSALERGSGADKRHWPAIELIVEFITKQNLMPDLFILAEEAKELHTNIADDLDTVRCLHWMVGEYFGGVIQVPVLGVITHVDAVYPPDLKLPTDYDEEKRANITRLWKVYDEVTMPVEHVSSAPMPWAHHRLNALTAVPVGCKAHWETRGSEPPTVIRPRDYRFNIEKLRDTLLTSPSTHWLPDDHSHFALELVNIFVYIARTISSAPHIDMLKKYQFLVYMVSVVSMELSSQQKLRVAERVATTTDCPTFDPADPTSFADAVKDFWLTLGLTNITYHSLKTVAAQLLDTMPMGPVLSASVSAGSGIALGLDDVARRLGESSVAYFVERRPRPECAQVFSGKLSYSPQ